MNKSEFIAYFAKKNRLQLNEAEEAINTFWQTLASALAENESVKITGAMSFRVNTRPAGKARNPKTGQIVDAEERRTISFSSGKYLKDAVNAPLKKAAEKRTTTAKKTTALLKKKKAVKK